MTTLPVRLATKLHPARVAGLPGVTAAGKMPVTYSPVVAQTVTSTLRRLPSLSAVTLAKPGACAVRVPSVEIDTTAALLVVQATDRSVSSFPSASRGTALSARLVPTPMATTPGVTAIEDTLT